MTGGDICGFAIVLLLSPVEGDQLKTVALLMVLGRKEAPLQIAVSACVMSVTAGATVTVKDLLILQLPVLPVTVYGVVLAGDNTGLAIVGSLTPVVGDQLYVAALLIVFALNEDPAQILVSACTVRARVLVRVMVTGMVIVQSALSVTVAT